jgi:hypothetical protein
MRRLIIIIITVCALYISVLACGGPGDVRPPGPADASQDVDEGGSVDGGWQEDAPSSIYYPRIGDVCELGRVGICEVDAFLVCCVCNMSSIGWQIDREINCGL